MREIKFRAWYANQEMHYGIAPIDNKYYIFFETQKRNAHDLQINRAISIMQYTGLKDKNGQDIYEGDVLYIKEKGRWGGEYIAPVEWLEWDDRNVVGGDKGEHWSFYGIVCMTVKEILHHKDVKSLFTIGFLTRRFGACIQLAEMTKDINRFEIKVIGNIFENPELLEESK